MSTSKTSSRANSSSVEPTIRKRVILTMGGKGGVGKTSVTLTIAEWLKSHEVPFTLLDLDTENKARGSLKHYYREARKVNIHTPAGLDTFIDAFDDGYPILLADMAAGSGQVAHEWFDTMHESAEDLGIGLYRDRHRDPGPGERRKRAQLGARTAAQSCISDRRE